MAGSMDVQIQAAQAIIGYTFDDAYILWEALSLAGSRAKNADGRLFPEGNKRLALHGDTFIKAALLDDWIHTGQTRAVGQDRVSFVASNANLAAVGFRNELGGIMNKNPSQGNDVSQAMMATTVEAIIGAVSLDSETIETVKKVMLTLGID